MIKKRIPRITSLIAFIVLIAIAGSLQYFSIYRRKTPAHFIYSINNRIIDELEEVSDQLAEINPNKPSFEMDYIHPVFVFIDGKLSFWSDFKVVPPYQAILGDFKAKYLELDQGKYLIVKETDGNIEIVVLVELFSTPPFPNKYLETGVSSHVFPEAVTAVDEAGAEEYDIYLSDGSELFGISLDIDSSIVGKKVQILIASLCLLAVLIGYLFIHTWVWYFGKENKVFRGLSILISGIAVIRGFMIYYNLPFVLFPSDLFNPLNYASSAINPSLGDLFLNVLSIIPVITYLAKFASIEKISKGSIGSDAVKVVIAVLILNIAGFFYLYYHYGLLQNILLNSQIELDINKSIELSQLRLISIAVLFSSTIIWFQLTHIIHRYSTGLIEKLKMQLILLLFAGLLFAITGILLDLDFEIVLISQVTYLILLHVLKLTDHLTQLRYTTLLYFFAAAVLSAVIGTKAIYEFHEFEEMINKQRFANELLIDNDLTGEYLIQEAAESISQDVFIQTRMISPKLDNNQIEEKIKREYLSEYFEKYDVKAQLYSKDGNPFGSYPDDSVLQQIRIGNNLEYQTDYQGLYFIHNVDSEKPKRYVKIISIERYDNFLGYVVLDMRLKKAIPKTVYPELLADRRFVDNDRAFDYAVYNGKSLNYQSGDFSYSSDFDTTNFSRSGMFVSGIERKGFHHFAINSSGDRTLVITSDVYPLSYVVSNFSFIFLSNVFGVIMLLLVRAFYNKSSFNLNFSAKIQLFLNLAFFVPLVITSVVILNAVNNYYYNEVNNASASKASTIKDFVVAHLDDYRANRLSRESLSNNLSEIARYSQSDLNLFDNMGRLIASSQPLIYSNNILSRWINPKALHEIVSKNKDDIVLNESVGSLDYQSTYAAVRSFDTGKLLGIIGIPFFGSREYLRSQTIDAFTDILNIFTLVLIAALFASNFVSGLLTRPLNLLTQKLRKTSLSVQNEPLKWRSKDEIGMVVQEYNKMLVNLEESKDELAKSQKESAWREIAKQVAHEIKNPLTPMKLSLQHLKRVLSEGKNTDNVLYEKPIDNMLHQIDTLSDIATSFSSFAKMPIPEKNRFELTKEVRQVAGLFASENVDLKVVLPDEDCYINGDQKLIGRTVSNLIINGIQSVDGSKKPEILIKMTRSSTKVTVEVHDNGNGIPEEIQSKVFVPDFSTKDTGSGVGLAIAKRGVEHAGGSIWFETDVKEGTTFYILLPLAD
ncbi:MAG: HAMP domain-containing sensor histidine kinase [Bacteroidetes bacterium]|nr:HAMP domain-containing sensor histidine kinase [Bacteroidota bacterium]